MSITSQLAGKGYKDFDYAPSWSLLCNDTNV